MDVSRRDLLADAVGDTGRQAQGACAETSVRLTRPGGDRNLALRWPEVIDAVRLGERRPAALMSTLRTLILSGPARPAPLVAAGALY